MVLQIRVARHALALAGPGSGIRHLKMQSSETFVCRWLCLKSRRSLSETQSNFVHARHLFNPSLSSDSSDSSPGSGSSSDAFVAPEPSPLDKDSIDMVLLRPNPTGRFPPPPEIHSKDVYRQVFTHRSVFARSKHEFEDLPNDPAQDNEVLEHLGDAVLGFVITGLIRECYRNLRVGPATKMKAMVVGNRTLADISVKYEFPQRLHSHNSQSMTLQQSGHIQADVLEAYIGGVYIDRGITVVSDWIKVLFLPYVKEAYRIVRIQYGLPPQRESTPLSPPSSPNFSGVGGGQHGGQMALPSGSDLDQNVSYSAGGVEASSGSYLSLFNQHYQKQNKTVEWVFSEGKGEGTNVTPIWSVHAHIDGRLSASGRGSTKKAAQNLAARDGLVKLGLVRE